MLLHMDYSEMVYKRTMANNCNQTAPIWGYWYMMFQALQEVHR